MRRRLDPLQRVERALLLVVAQMKERNRLLRQSVAGDRRAEKRLYKRSEALMSAIGEAATNEAAYRARPRDPDDRSVR